MDKKLKSDKFSFGKHGNVLMTAEEFLKLKHTYPHQYKGYISHADRWLEKNKNKAIAKNKKCHFDMIVKWIEQDASEKTTRGVASWYDWSAYSPGEILTKDPYYAGISCAEHDMLFNLLGDEKFTEYYGKAIYYTDRNVFNLIIKWCVEDGLLEFGTGKKNEPTKLSDILAAAKKMAAERTAREEAEARCAGD